MERGIQSSPGLGRVRPLLAPTLPHHTHPTRWHTAVGFQSRCNTTHPRPARLVALREGNPTQRRTWWPSGRWVSDRCVRLGRQTYGASLRMASSCGTSGNTTESQPKHTIKNTQNQLKPHRKGTDTVREFDECLEWLLEFDKLHRRLAGLDPAEFHEDGCGYALGSCLVGPCMRHLN